MVHLRRAVPALRTSIQPSLRVNHPNGDDP
jgi:hypothetical protein